MFEYIIVACAVYGLNGETSNPCFGEKSSVQFPSYYSCRAEADKREEEMLLFMDDNFPKALPVATAHCVDV